MMQQMGIPFVSRCDLCCYPVPSCQALACFGCAVRSRHGCSPRCAGLRHHAGQEARRRGRGQAEEQPQRAPVHEPPGARCLPAAGLPARNFFVSHGLALFLVRQCMLRSDPTVLLIHAAAGRVQPPAGRGEDRRQGPHRVAAQLAPRRPAALTSRFPANRSVVVTRSVIEAAAGEQASRWVGGRCQKNACWQPCFPTARLLPSVRGIRPRNRSRTHRFAAGRLPRQHAAGLARRSEWKAQKSPKWSSSSAACCSGASTWPSTSTAPRWRAACPAWRRGATCLWGCGGRRWMPARPGRRWAERFVVGMSLPARARWGARLAQDLMSKADDARGAALLAVQQVGARACSRSPAAVVVRSVCPVCAACR